MSVLMESLDDNKWKGFKEKVSQSSSEPHFSDFKEVFQILFPATFAFLFEFFDIMNKDRKSGVLWCETNIWGWE